MATHTLPPDGMDPRYVVVHKETGERRVMYSVDYAELMNSPDGVNWRRETFLASGNPVPGAPSLRPTGAGAAFGEPVTPALKGAPIADRAPAHPQSEALATRHAPAHPGREGHRQR